MVIKTYGYSESGHSKREQAKLLTLWGAEKFTCYMDAQVATRAALYANLKEIADRVAGGAK